MNIPEIAMMLAFFTIIDSALLYYSTFAIFVVFIFITILFLEILSIIIIFEKEMKK
jgi:hypothetical protein